MNQATRYLAATPLWAEQLDTMRQRVTGHGDAARWEQALTQLPAAPQDIFPCPSGIGVGGSLTTAEQVNLNAALRVLHPWRKGPFTLFDLQLNTEWRSDWKWQRLAPHLPTLRDARVLDVGCGNGYYGWQMLRAGADTVVGVDPTVLFLYQHLALAHYLNSNLNQRRSNWVLPLRGEELPAPASPADAFDLVCSMGVLYHRRDPAEHLQQLVAQLRPGGHLVLETLVSETADLHPAGRYARMRNVHVVPTAASVSAWLAACGLGNTAAVDVTPTTVAEQRSTPWMTFESLQQALDPANPAQTVEGHPAPIRAIFVAELPGLDYS